jgi:hypothetical protein
MALIEAFCDELLKLSQIIVVIQNADGEIRKHSQPVPVLPLHRSRGRSEPWTEDTSTSHCLLNENPDMELFQDAQCRPVLEARPLAIFVATRDFNVAFSLEELIINCAADCGITPLYDRNTMLWWLWRQVRKVGCRG